MLWTKGRYLRKQSIDLSGVECQLPGTADMRQLNPNGCRQSKARTRLPPAKADRKIPCRTGLQEYSEPQGMNPLTRSAIRPFRTGSIEDQPTQSGKDYRSSAVTFFVVRVVGTTEEVTNDRSSRGLAPSAVQRSGWQVNSRTWWRCAASNRTRCIRSSRS